MTTVKPCPKCSARDWEFQLFGTQCAGCGYVTDRIPIAKQKATAEKAEGALRERLAMEAGTELFGVEAERVAQLTAEREHLEKLITAFEIRAERSRLEPGHPLTIDAWTYRARVDYVAETIALLEQVSHPLACPVCRTARGVEGFLAGGGRLCERCVLPNLERRGAELMAGLVMR